MTEEHWLDRLAAPHTRRQGLKAALAGAALTLPLIRSTPGGAAPGEDCFKGCLFTTKKNFDDNVNSCNANVDGALASYFVGGGPALTLYAALLRRPVLRSCLDRSVAQARNENLECMQPRCGSFNPFRGANAPCFGCAHYCNPCKQLETGYICCVYPQGDCHGDCCTPGTGCP